MATYEVFIPAVQGSEFNVTLKVDAENWMAALRTGMRKLGEGGSAVVNIMVDVHDDNTIHVTDASSGRVFRLRELDTAQAVSVPGPVVPAAPPPSATPPPAIPPAAVAPPPVAFAAPTPAVEPVVVPAPAPAPAPKPAPKPAEAKTVPGFPAFAPPSEKKGPEPKLPESQRPTLPPPEPAPLAKPAPVAEKPTAALPKAGIVAQTEPPPPERIGRQRKHIEIEDLLAELFERTQHIYELGRDRARGMEFLMDLAMEKIPAEAGSIFVCLETPHLELASVRGPKTEELKKLNLRIPIGVGIVGFCAQEAVSLAISDTQKDPRFFRDVSDKLGYPAKSILCCPMVREGRSFGAIEIINRKGGSTFTEAELSSLAYLAHQGARFLEQF